MLSTIHILESVNVTLLYTYACCTIQQKNMMWLTFHQRPTLGHFTYHMLIFKIIVLFLCGWIADFLMFTLHRPLPYGTFVWRLICLFLLTESYYVVVLRTWLLIKVSPGCLALCTEYSTFPFKDIGWMFMPFMDLNPNGLFTIWLILSTLSQTLEFRPCQVDFYTFKIM